MGFSPLTVSLCYIVNRNSDVLLQTDGNCRDCVRERGVVPEAPQFYFHVTKKSFHAAHVSIPLHRRSLPAFPLAFDTGKTFTVGKLKDTSQLAQSELHSCHIFSICSNQVTKVF